jgi:hypothetical protein
MRSQQKGYTDPEANWDGIAMRKTGCVAAFLIFLFSVPVLAQLAITVSSSPDTKTRFVWTGGELKENRDRTLYLVVEHGGQKTGTGVSDEIDVRFARAEAGKIKWCSYVGTELQVTKCKPSQPLKPDGVINVK